MARKTIRVEVPVKSPDAFSKLLNDILSQHTVLAGSSPLKGNAKIDMAAFTAALQAGDGKRKDSQNLKAQSEQKMQEAKTIYGIAQAQNVSTPGTLYNLQDVIKDILLVAYKGNEEELSKWGYNVVVGQAKSPTQKVKKS